MPLYSLTKERVEDLRAKIAAKQEEIAKLEKASIEDLWLKDLNKLELIYRRDLESRGFTADD